jgi:hypothetical protein
LPTHYLRLRQPAWLLTRKTVPRSLYTIFSILFSTAQVHDPDGTMSKVRLEFPFDIVTVE